jgi:aspartate 1-decarboxylase
VSGPPTKPHVVHLDARNAIVGLGADPSAPVPGAEDQRSGAIPVRG